MTLFEENRESIIAYRLEKATETINQVKEIAKLGYYSILNHFIRQIHNLSQYR